MPIEQPANVIEHMPIKKTLRKYTGRFKVTVLGSIVALLFVAWSFRNTKRRKFGTQSP
jgi:hypothetical protein